MKWYDLFSTFYDRSLEQLYDTPRKQALVHLAPDPDSIVLDLACGTGQNFKFIAPHVTEGCIIGLDNSKGMLRKAQERIEQHEWPFIALVDASVEDFDQELITQLTGAEALIDRIVCTLGFSAFPNWKSVLEDTVGILSPGGRIVIMDVIAEKRTLQTRIVEWMARADLNRQIGNHLKTLLPDAEIEFLSGDPKTFGGRLFVAHATKPH